MKSCAIVSCPDKPVTDFCGPHEEMRKHNLRYLRPKKRTKIERLTGLPKIDTQARMRRRYTPGFRALLQAAPEQAPRLEVEALIVYGRVTEETYRLVNAVEDDAGRISLAYP